MGEEEGIHVIIIINIQSCRLPFLPLGDGKVHVAHYFIGGGLVPKSVVSDSCNPVDCSPPGSSVPGISQARILQWVAISFSNFIGAEQKIPGWQIKIAFQVQVKTAMSLDIKSRLGNLGFSTGDITWGPWFLFLTGIKPVTTGRARFCLLRASERWCRKVRKVIQSTTKGWIPFQMSDLQSWKMLHLCWLKPLCLC